MIGIIGSLIGVVLGYGVAYYIMNPERHDGHIF